MCAESQNQDDNIDSNEENRRDFAAMMKRWGIEVPDETAKPLGIDMLIEKWCESKFSRPMAAIKELREGRRHIEAAAALFVYYYSVLSPSFFGWTIEQCLEWHVGNIEKLRETSGLDQQTTQILLEHEQHNVMVCRDLIDFFSDYSAGRFQYPEGQDIAATSSYVDVLLAAVLALASLSGEDKEYDPYLCQNLERAFVIIKQGKVQQAQRFSALNLSNNGRELSGDVEGFLACLGCAAVCFSLAWVKSELSPEHERDYETAFRAYIHGAENMRRTDYRIGAFFGELFAPESEKGNGGIDIYWRIVGAWEEVRKNIERVRNWRELRNCLEDLVEIMWHEGYDTEFGSYPDTEESGVVYLKQQISFLDGRLSQEEIIELMDQQKRNQHDKRLRIDFFEDLWWHLEEGTREHLISAESEWYDGPDRRSYVESAIEHYSATLEIELRALLFSIDEVRCCVERIMNRQRKNRSNAAPIKLRSRDATSLNLKDISKLLKHVAQSDESTEPIRKVISSLPVAENKRALLMKEEFLDDLHDIYQLRIDSTHSLDNPHILRRTHNLRKKILGIGCAGYLMSLAAMKKQAGEHGHSKE